MPVSVDDEDFVDRALTAYVTGVPGRFVALTALLLYPGLGLVAPLLLGWPSNWFFAVNVATVGAAAVLCLAWFVVQLERSQRRHLVDWTTNLRLLSSEEFEWFVGEVFRREGWSVRETGSQSRADGNIDLELTKGGERRLIQCKAWQSRQVPIDQIRAFGGTLLREGRTGADAIFVTLSDFNEHARAEAKRLGIALIDGRDLFRRAEAVRRSEPCPECSQPMMLGKSEHGWWFRCTTAGCRGKRNLDSDAGRAIDMLTQPPAKVFRPARD